MPQHPGQHRGVPELAAALPLFAQLRQYTQSVVESASKAAEYGGVLYTDNPTVGLADAMTRVDAFQLGASH